MLKRGFILIAVLLAIFIITYSSITSLTIFSPKDKISYSTQLLSIKILSAELTNNQVKALIKNEESINVKLFFIATGSEGTDSLYDTNTLEAKSTKYFLFNIDKEKTGNFISSITITPYQQFQDGSKLVYKFSSSSYQINQRLPETTTQPKTPPSTPPPILTTPTIKETTYIYANGLIASIDDTGNINYYHKDNLGSIRAITNDQGNIIYTSSYEPFGSQFSETGSSEYSYTGKPKDDTNLYYYGARYYDSSLGRFTQTDPILNIETSPYVYVENNPMKFIDPTGAQALDDREYRVVNVNDVLVVTPDVEVVSEYEPVVSEYEPWQMAAMHIYLNWPLCCEYERNALFAKSAQNWGVSLEEWNEFLESNFKPIEQSIFSILIDERYTYRSESAIVREVQKEYPRLEIEEIGGILFKMWGEKRIKAYRHVTTDEMHYRVPGHKANEYLKEEPASLIYKAWKHWEHIFGPFKMPPKLIDLRERPEYEGE